MKEDFKKFTFLQKVLVIIDLILNPRAYNYPFIYSLKGDYDFYRIKPPYHLVVKEFIKGDEYHMWCIRWL